jgi:hypothetical protein
MKSVTCIVHTNDCYDHYLIILEYLSGGSTAANESILAPFSKQTESFHSPRGIGRLTDAYIHKFVTFLHLT